MPVETTQGLQNDPTAAATLEGVQWAAASGSANAITAAFPDPFTALADGTIVGVRASAANTSATPTFSPDGLTARTIVKNGGQALLAGDIPGANAELLLRYNLANTRWELLNPASQAPRWAVAGGSADAITATYAPAILALTDGLLVAFRAGAANTSATPTFSPNGLTARTIVGNGGQSLGPGDISANGEYLLRYNLANTRWEILGSNSADIFKWAAGQTGANSSTAQPWFVSGGTLTLGVGTYEFEGFLYLDRSAGSTSHTTGILFAGTATVAAIQTVLMAKEGDANDLQDMSGIFAQAATETVVKATSTSTTEKVLIFVKGNVNISVAGTFVPQFKYSAAPGGAPTVGASFRIRKTPANSFGPWS